MFKSKSNSGSLLVEAIVVLGLIATFTPLLYKHVSDRRDDIDNINRANTLLYLRQKTEEWLHDPNNTITTSLTVDKPGKVINPGTISTGLARFDGKYVIGIRREDVNGTPTYKALIVDKTDSGSDLKAGKVANLIGTSAGIYSAMDSANAWGVNGVWKEQISNYFDTSTTPIPTGSVIVSTEFSRSKEQQRLSDLLIDADLDMGDYNIKTEGTVKAGTIVARNRFCIGDPTDDNNCVASMDDIGGDKSACAGLQLIQECDAGVATSCNAAAKQKLNTGCSNIAAIYSSVKGAGLTCSDAVNSGNHSIAFDGGNTVIKTQCSGDSYTTGTKTISTANLSNPVSKVGPGGVGDDQLSFGITTAGTYQIVLRGEPGYSTSNSTNAAAGAIVTANVTLEADTVLTLKAIKGGKTSDTEYGGAGIALYQNDEKDPILVAGGGASGLNAGGGILGGSCAGSGCTKGFSLGDTTTSPGGGNSNRCSFGANAAGNLNSCITDYGALGGAYYAGSANYAYGGSGTKTCPAAPYNDCNIIPGGNATAYAGNFPGSVYGNNVYGNSSATSTTVFASISLCSDSSCTTTNAPCNSDIDCDTANGYICNFTTGVCNQNVSCTDNSDCAAHDYAGKCIGAEGSKTCQDVWNCTDAADCPAHKSYCYGGQCTGDPSCTDAASTCPSGQPYCNNGHCSSDNSGCTANANCPSGEGYCRTDGTKKGTCQTTECDGDTDCPGGYVCNSGTCEPDVIACTMNNYATQCTTAKPYCVIDSTGTGTCEAAYTCPTESVGIKLGGTTWSSSNPMPTTTWINGWSSFYTPCPDGQYMADNRCSSYYPSPSGKCYDIPNLTADGSTSMKTLGGHNTPRETKALFKRFTMNGKTYYIMNLTNWWEGQEICAKLVSGGTLPPKDWLVANYSAILSASDIGESYVYSKNYDSDTSGLVWQVFLDDGRATSVHRHAAVLGNHVLCSSAEGYTTPCTQDSECTDSSKPYCNLAQGICVDTPCGGDWSKWPDGSAVTCSTMQAKNDENILHSCYWIANWSKCSSCGAGQFQQIMGREEERILTAYTAIPATDGCVTIPAACTASDVTFSTARSKGCAGVSVHSDVIGGSSYKGTMYHLVKDVSDGTTTKTYHMVGPYVNWWEAQEICDKLGLSMPSDYISYATTSSLKTLGTNIYNSFFGSSGVIRFWTNKLDDPTSLGMWLVFYKYARTNARNFATNVYYVLCSSAS